MIKADTWKEIIYVNDLVLYRINLIFAKEMLRLGLLEEVISRQAAHTEFCISEIG